MEDAQQERLTHFDADGQPHMVDVSAKEVTLREAVAEATVFVAAATRDLIEQGGVRKGDVITVAELAGIMAAKRTSEWIPLCHPLPLSHVSLQCQWGQRPTAQQEDTAHCELTIRATVRTSGRTGVEMEALTACTAAALTVYDMCKSVERGMEIGRIRLVYKAGGKSGVFGQRLD